jgi:hypothetical protein
MMSEQTVAYGVALLLVLLAAATMMGLHRNHYERRRYQLLAGRVAALESIVTGEHE